MMEMVIFVQRPHENDMPNRKVVECSQCPWFTTYDELLWTSNDMPDDQRKAFTEVADHARVFHRSYARILRGWRP